MSNVFIDGTHVFYHCIELQNYITNYLQILISPFPTFITLGISIPLLFNRIYYSQ